MCLISVRRRVLCHHHVKAWGAALAYRIFFCYRTHPGVIWGGGMPSRSGGSACRLCPARFTWCILMGSVLYDSPEVPR